MWRELTIISSQLNSNSPIGFFDSGVGGLTVLSAFRAILPEEDCIFFGDTKNMPYGEKTKDQLLTYSKQAFEFFETQGVKAVIMACNTTSATVYDELKDKYNFKLYPLIQSVAKIVASMDFKSIGVFATPATINSHAYSKNIQKYNNSINVYEIACPEWVKFVENNEINSEKCSKSIKEYMELVMQNNPDKIILGCTHYPYLTEKLSKYAPKEMFINPAKMYVDFIKNDLNNLKLLNNKNTKGYDLFYVSAHPDKFISAGKQFYNVIDCKLQT